MKCLWRCYGCGASASLLGHIPEQSASEAREVGAQGYAVFASIPDGQEDPPGLLMCPQGQLPQPAQEC